MQTIVSQCFGDLSYVGGLVICLLALWHSWAPADLWLPQNEKCANGRPCHIGRVPHFIHAVRRHLHCRPVVGKVGWRKKNLLYTVVLSTKNKNEEMSSSLPSMFYGEEQAVNVLASCSWSHKEKEKVRDFPCVMHPPPTSHWTKIKSSLRKVLDTTETRQGRGAGGTQRSDARWRRFQRHQRWRLANEEIRRHEGNDF